MTGIGKEKNVKEQICLINEVKKKALPEEKETTDGDLFMDLTVYIHLDYSSDLMFLNREQKLRLYRVLRQIPTEVYSKELYVGAQ